VPQTFLGAGFILEDDQGSVVGRQGIVLQILEVFNIPELRQIAKDFARLANGGRTWEDSEMDTSTGDGAGQGCHRGDIER
jgi:hypothetical protein